MSQQEFETVPRQYTAICLLSGGLDSQLATCVLKSQQIRIHAVVFESPFFGSESARKAADRLGIPLHVLDFSADIISLLREPKHGFGAQMNPCLDCHLQMLHRAGRLMEELGGDFLATGEVLRQRPMSQNMEAMRIVESESGYHGFVVRPLSARHLPETEPERLGWLDREKLLDIAGRSRDRQLNMARQYGLTDFPSPAGGCRLTDPNFAKRLRDLQNHEGLNGVRSINLLRVGRHFRLADNVKLIVGRNEKDNILLEGNAELYDLVIKVADVPSPTGLLPFTAREEHIQQAAAICARYSDQAPGQKSIVRIRSSRGVRQVETSSASDEEIEKVRL